MYLVDCGLALILIGECIASPYRSNQAQLQDMINESRERM
jgi:hypothetical protein